MVSDEEFYEGWWEEVYLLGSLVFFDNVKKHICYIFVKTAHSFPLKSELFVLCNSHLYLKQRHTMYPLSQDLGATSSKKVHL